MAGLNNFDPNGDDFVPAPGTNIDWDVALDGPIVDITEGSSVLQFDATEFVHLRWRVQGADGSDVTLTANSNVTSMAMAIVRGEPEDSDWFPATLITRVAGDETDGEYSEIKIGQAGALALTQGRWLVFGQLITTGETIVRQAPGTLIVNGLL